MLGRWAEEDLWGTLASRPSLVCEPQVPGRDPVSKKLRWYLVRNNTRSCPLDFTSMYMHMHTSLHTGIHISSRMTLDFRILLFPSFSLLYFLPCQTHR